MVLLLKSTHPRDRRDSRSNTPPKIRRSTLSETTPLKSSSERKYPSARKAERKKEGTQSERAGTTRTKSKCSRLHMASGATIVGVPGETE